MTEFSLSLVIISIWFFVLGCAMGSFYKVIIDRMPNDQSIIKGRSHCPNCNHKLVFFDLIPVISYIFQKGKCRYCHKKISINYLIFELLVGLLFTVAFFSFMPKQGLIGVFFAIVLWSMMLIVSIIDFKYQFIMDIILVVFFAPMLLLSLYNIKLIPFRIHGALIGFVFYGLVYLLAKWIYKKEGFGSGDVFLIALIGYYFGAIKTIITGFLGFYICFLFIIYWKLVKKSADPVPFAPSLCIAAFTMSLYGDVISKTLLIYLGVFT